MTKWMIITSTAFVWTAGFAATAALSRAVTPPALVKAAPTVVVAKMPPPVRVAESAPGDQPTTIVLPTVEIVGTLPRVAKRKPPPPPPPRALAEMHCHPFQPLEQGSSSVQICD